jgi:hypothetical protein
MARAGDGAWAGWALAWQGRAGTRGLRTRGFPRSRSLLREAFRVDPARTDIQHAGSGRTTESSPMLRRLTALAAALLMTVGLGLATTGSGAASAVPGVPTARAAAAVSVIPHHGSYAGVDHHGRMVTFSFNGNQVAHFAVNHQVLGGAHVSNGAWHETCHNGMCTKGMWSTDGHVTGSWRSGGGTWTSFTASSSPRITPYSGTYLGSDHSGLSIHFSFGNGFLRGFRVDHNHVGDAAAGSGKFETCHQTICFKGHWETEYMVVGSWRHANSSQWRPFEAYAYAT